MKIGIFGGAFNPPHTGHTNAAKNAISERYLDILIIIPTGIPPHKEMPQDTPSPQMRFQMAENAFTGISKKVIISDIEIYCEYNNYTIDTVKKLSREYPGADFCLLVGNDMYDSLDTWKDSSSLLRLVTPVLLDRSIVDISSTEIRSMLAQRDGISYLDDENYSLIIKHRLYGAKPNLQWLRNKAYAMLSDSRKKHTKGCEETAAALAEHWGECIDDAREAAILHDITKELDFDANMCIIAENGLVTNNYKKSEQKLLHSYTASLIAKSEFGVSDKVAQAIRLHTTGAAEMSLLDKIIYIADYIEPARDFPGVQQLRHEAFIDLENAMKTGLQMVVDDLTSRGVEINSSTYEALKSLSLY